eukprot:3030547-Ditylum_brightwellii.AAC.1
MECISGRSSRREGGDGSNAIGWKGKKSCDDDNDKAAVLKCCGIFSIQKEPINTILSLLITPVVSITSLVKDMVSSLNPVEPHGTC